MSLSQLFSRSAHLLWFVTCSCRSFSSEIMLSQLGLDFAVYKLYFIALRETRRPPDAQLVHVSHCNATIFFLEGGMRVVVSDRLQQHLQSSHSVSNCVTVVIFCFGGSAPPMAL